MPTEKESSSPLIYQLKVTLKDSRPPIWRRIQVAGDTTLAKLHRILQVAMGWDDGHLHQFMAHGSTYGVPYRDFDFGLSMKNEKNVKLSQVAPQIGTKFVYEYDFGDSWQHAILVEKILSAEEGVRYPICLKGKRACPPEDVGGVWGYESFLEAIKDPKHPEHEDMLEWIDGEFDPEEFSIDEVNEMLRRVR